MSGIGPGRPRHSGPSGPMAPRDQILGVSAKLFVTQGFANTSTREIAETVGIRQASLYYHFANKDEILGELLRKTVRPTTDKMNQIKTLPVDPGTQLYLLALLDIRTLRKTPHNTAFLAYLPEVTRSSVFDGYKADRRELAERYELLGRAVEARSPNIEPSPLNLGQQLLQMVEHVIACRRAGDPVNAEGIASSCLRICGATTDQVTRAAFDAAALLDELEDL